MRRGDLIREGFEYALKNIHEEAKEERVRIIKKYMSEVKLDRTLTIQLKEQLAELEEMEETEPAKQEEELPQSFTNSLGMEFVLIPAGTFMMGSPEDEPERKSIETLHQVTISQSFYMAATPVTQREWVTIMGNNPSYFRKNGEDCPVEQVSWNDAQKFIKQLNQREERNYRLPSEAEWEYACRAGTTTPFNTGNCLSTDDANYNGNYPYKNCPKGKYRKRTTPVKKFTPNAWGLYDMHGNVWEWCQDDYDDYPSTSVVDPTGSTTGSFRVSRGGSWNFIASYCRSANRNRFKPEIRYYYMSFRLCAPGR